MEKTLQATLQPTGNYILLKLNGDLVQDKVEQFRADLKEASTLITDQYYAHDKKLHILIDLTHFTGNYSLDSLSLLTEFAKNNKPFIEKTASFGGSYKIKMAGEIIVVLSHRDNIKMFDQKEEALAWLLGMETK